MTDPQTRPPQVTQDDIWVEVVNRVPAPTAPGPVRRPALFLDRDGVMVEERPYLHRIEEAVMVPGVVAAVAEANRRGLPVAVVTNQGGIALRKYGWEAFAVLQDWISERLAEADAFVNAVLACPHHPKAVGPLQADDHPDRKPNPGMFLRAAEILPIDRGASWIVGDRTRDLVAGKAAGLAGGVHLVSSHESSAGEAAQSLALADDTFRVLVCEDATTLTEILPLF